MHFLSHATEDGAPISRGCFAEISTLHLSAKTARLLDLWAGPLAAEAPVLVAANVHGWFVATRPMALILGAGCPGDLVRALRFGRFWGVDYLFFHCDAPVVADLPRLTW